MLIVRMDTLCRGSVTDCYRHVRVCVCMLFFSKHRIGTRNERRYFLQSLPTDALLTLFAFFQTRHMAFSKDAATRFPVSGHHVNVVWYRLKDDAGLKFSGRRRDSE